MTNRTLGMINDAEKELCNLKGEPLRSWDERRKEYEPMRQIDGIKKLQQLNKEIKKLGGNIIGKHRTNRRKKHNAK